MYEVRNDEKKINPETTELIFLWCKLIGYIVHIPIQNQLMLLHAVKSHLKNHKDEITLKCSLSVHKVSIQWAINKLAS